MLPVQTLDPRRPLVPPQANCPPPPPSWADRPAQPIDRYQPAERPRIEEQQQLVEQTFRSLAEDARLAAIMFNPIFMPHAQVIASQATARALYRYETEVPRKDLATLMGEERAAARAAILDLPRRYYETGAEALSTAGDYAVQAAEATGNAVVTAARTTGEAVVGGTLAVVGGLWAGLKAGLRGLGSVFSWIGGNLEAAGS